MLILDEPASGLDPRARVEMREILKELKNMGKTILISSHILPELAEMCDVLGIIDQGKLKAQGTVAEIQHKLQGEKSLIVKVHQDVERSIAFLKTILTLVKSASILMGKRFSFYSKEMHLPNKNC